jgi:hypothetical protein
LGSTFLLVRPIRTKNVPPRTSFIFTGGQLWSQCFPAWKTHDIFPRLRGTLGERVDVRGEKICPPGPRAYRVTRPVLPAKPSESDPWPAWSGHAFED